MSQSQYSIKELATDVRLLINYLKKNGIIGKLGDVGNFHGVTLLTEDGEVEIDLLDGMEFEVPPHVVRQVRWYMGRI